jgi:hypothetical protein
VLEKFLEDEDDMLDMNLTARSATAALAVLALSTDGPSLATRCLLPSTGHL